jgi:hypothetical protein
MQVKISINELYKAIYGPPGGVIFEDQPKPGRSLCAEELEAAVRRMEQWQPLPDLPALTPIKPRLVKHSGCWWCNEYWSPTFQGAYLLWQMNQLMRGNHVPPLR